ncbi:MAG TPA: hypothetical protein VK121_09745 [Pseudogracilibacillus sp.]|nr:hypothetical protein [Pseudogracilibacillus sp.]
MRKNMEVIIIGILTSFVLGGFLKFLETITNLKVYTLLLNIDFVPILGEINFPEWIEFSFHIIVSIIITFIFYHFVIKYKWNWQGILFYVSLGNMFIGLLIYPITLFSDRTPPLLAIFPLNFWLIGHLIYGISMSLLFILIENKHNIKKAKHKKNKDNIIPFK